MPNVIPTTIYFKTDKEKAEAEAKARERDMSLSALVRTLLRDAPRLPRRSK